MADIAKLFRQVVAEEMLSWTLKGLVTTEESVKVLYSPNQETASWIYLPPHRIYLNDFVKDTATEGQAVRRGRALLRHELCHYLLTERDPDKVKRLLAASGAVFDLYNLFEDARIEQHYRETYNESFSWDEVLPAESIPQTPSGLLFAIVQHERVPDWPTEYPEASPELTVRVEDYYARICAAEDSMALTPVLRDWVAEFPESNVARSVTGNSPLYQQVMLNTEREAREERLVELAPQPEDTSPELVPGSVKGTVMLNDYPVVALDSGRVARMARRLEGLLGQSEGKERWTSREVGRRLDTRRLGLGVVQYLHERNKPTQELSLVLFFDCSASMAGFPQEEGCHLVAALNLLAQRKRMSGYLVLSRVSRLSGNAEFQTLRFPVAESDILRIPADGIAEGLAYAIEENLEIVRKCSNAFVYTDANIGDKPLNRHRLREQGVEAVGLYVSEEDEVDSEGMEMHFDRYIVRQTAESLVEALVQRKSNLTRRAA